MANIKALAVLSIVLVAVVLVSGCVCTSCCGTDDYLSGDATTYESPGDCTDGGDDCLLAGASDADAIGGAS